MTNKFNNNSNNKYKITINKNNFKSTTPTPPNLQIINNLFDVGYSSNLSTSPFHYEFLIDKLSFLILLPNDIQELNNSFSSNGISNSNELNKQLVQFNKYIIENKLNGFIIIESLIGNTLQFGKKRNLTNIMNNDEYDVGSGSSSGTLSKIKEEFLKFQINYLNLNFKYLFSSSQTETFEIMLKCLNENKITTTTTTTTTTNDKILKTTFNNTNVSTSTTTTSITDSLFSRNEKLKLLKIIGDLKISDCQFLLKENEISDILNTLEKEKDKFENNDGVNNQVDKSILSVYKFIEKDSLL